jgi:hypothetical protein
MNSLFQRESGLVESVEVSVSIIFLDKKTRKTQPTRNWKLSKHKTCTCNTKNRLFGIVVLLCKPV